MIRTVGQEKKIHHVCSVRYERSWKQEKFQTVTTIDGNRIVEKSENDCLLDCRKMSQAIWSGTVAWSSIFVVYHALKAIEICKHNASVCYLLFLLFPSRVFLLFSLRPNGWFFDWDAVNIFSLPVYLSVSFSLSLVLFLSNIEWDSMLYSSPICIYSLIRCYRFLIFCLHKSRAAT